MDLPGDALQRLITAFPAISLLSSAIALVWLIAILYTNFLNPRNPQIFPKWAAIEIATTVYAVRKEGLIKRI